MKAEPFGKPIVAALRSGTPVHMQDTDLAHCNEQVLPFSTTEKTRALVA